MNNPTDILAKFFFDRSTELAFSIDDFTSSVWSGTEADLQELVVAGYIERPLGDKFVLTPSGRSLIGANWNRS